MSFRGWQTMCDNFTFDFLTCSLTGLSTLVNALNLKWENQTHISGAKFQNMTPKTQTGNEERACYLFIYFWHPNSMWLKPHKWLIISLLPRGHQSVWHPRQDPIRLTDFWKKVPKLRLTVHKGSKQRFNSNQAFLFMQKSRSAPQALH